jgi:hypothetical protein
MKMKKSDLMLIVSLIVLSAVSFLFVSSLQRRGAQADGIALVIYQNQTILTIELATSAYTIVQPDHVFSVDGDVFVVRGTLGPVTIERHEGVVRIIDETSPQNICQLQGSTNSTLKPLTCLPNDLVIRIESNTFNEDDEDAILS